MKLGCILKPETVEFHAGLALTAQQLLPAWSRITGTPRILGHNDVLGDCVVVAAINRVQTQLARLGSPAVIPDDLAPAIYSEVTGYMPGQPATDQGTLPEQLFTWWQANAIFGWKLREAIPLNPLDQAGQRNSIVTANGVMLCSALGQANLTQFAWEPCSDLIGYHATFADGYEANYTSETSWGTERQVPQAFFAAGKVVAAYSLDLIAA